MVVEKNDAFALIMLGFFFLSQILSGTARTIMLLLFGVVLICFVIRQKSNLWSALFLIVLLQKALQRVTVGNSYRVVTYLDEILDELVQYFLLE